MTLNPSLTYFNTTQNATTISRGDTMLMRYCVIIGEDGPFYFDDAEFRITCNIEGPLPWVSCSITIIQMPSFRSDNLFGYYPITTIETPSACAGDRVDDTTPRPQR